MGSISTEEEVLYRIAPLTVYDNVSLSWLTAITHAGMGNPEWLRSVTPVKLDRLLREQYIYGIREDKDHALAGAVVLCDGTDPEYDLSKYVAGREPAASPVRALVVKTVWVRPDRQGQGLCSLLLGRAREHATENGFSLMSCTIHENNTASMRAFTRNGFTVVCSAETVYGPRQILESIVT